MRALILSLVVVVSAAAGAVAGSSGADRSRDRSPAAHHVQTQSGRGAGQAGAPISTGTGLLMGQVIDAISGQPIAEAIVSIGGGAARGAAAGQQPRVIVDGQGRFLFRDLPAGSFSLNATKTGYFGGASGQKVPNGPSRPVELGDGERLGDVTLRLWPYGSVSGTILDDTNAPVAGIEAELLRRSASNGQWQWVNAGSVTTDDRGAYRFGSVTPGNYVVEARSSGVQGEQLMMSLLMRDEATLMKLMPKIIERGQESLMIDTNVHLYPATFYPAVQSSAQATVIAVASGEARANIDLHVKQVSARTIAGTAAGIDPANTSMLVRLGPADAAATDSGANTSFASLDPLGRFVFSGVAPGQYVIEAVSRPRTTAASVQAAQTAMAAARGTGPQPAPAAPVEPTLCATLPVTVADRDIAGLSLALHPGGRVSGHVEFDGGSEHPAADSWPQITVTLTPLDSSLVQIEPGRVEADGTFRTASVPPGHYLLRVGPALSGRVGGPGTSANRGSAAPTSTWRARSAMVDGHDALDQPMQVDTADIDNVVITFTDQKMATLSGTVRDAAGAPDPDAVILVFPSDNRLWADLSGTSRRVKPSRTTRSGSYVIPGLPAGEYFVVTGTDDMLTDWQAPDALNVLSQRAARVQITDGQAQTLDLKSGGR